MVDSVDLVVLGSYLGKGVYGGQQSVWLLGAREEEGEEQEEARASTSVTVPPSSSSSSTVTPSPSPTPTPVWHTVAKVGNGMTDADTTRFNADIPMVRLPPPPHPLPPWLRVSPTLRPHFIVADPLAAPVWQITGHALTRSTTHTGGVSVRFPRLARERGDREPGEATTLGQLRSMLLEGARIMRGGRGVGGGRSGRGGEDA